jgi:hypothetical protein
MTRILSKSVLALSILFLLPIDLLHLQAYENTMIQLWQRYVPGCREKNAYGS